MSDRDIPILGPIINRLIGSRNERFVKRYTQRVAEMSSHEPAMRKLSDAQLRAKIDEFRQRHDRKESSEAIQVEAFAVAREAMDRSVGLRNVFNPRYAFDPSTLPPFAEKLYHETKAAMDALEPVPPTGEWMGGEQPIAGWQRVDIPVELYEAIRELYPDSKPPFRARPFDVQLIGAMVLSQGKIAEMKTGEGKTIVGPLACYFAGCERMKVHVVTVNDYLVQRDRDWTAPFFRAVGMTVGAIHPQHMQDEEQKRVMYRCDVVYGTTAEFGFDYLRDNMKRRQEEQVQRKRQFAIVDEVDSILIDEARTPLIISGPAHEDEPRYELADRLARHLVERQRPWAEADEKVQQCLLTIKSLEGDIRQLRDKARLAELQSQLTAAKKILPDLQADRDKHTQFYEVKLERKQALVTHDGIAEAQRVAGVGSFYVDQNIDLPHLLEQSVRAHVVYQLDRDYIIMEQSDPRTGQMQPAIVIVDVNTGRPMVGRQWSDGLHQAIECKERVPVKQETQTVATITIQNFFKMYRRLAGMTGTADTEAQEFHDIYKLDVVAIPTNKPVSRRDFDHVVYLTGKDKWSAIVDEIKNFHDVGRPVLIGTTSVEKSEKLSEMLTGRYGIKHEVLNAKPEKIAREAEVVEAAGQLGSLMIATNMAGRGTDIKLGQFTRDQLLEHWLRRGIAPRTLTTDMTDEQLREQIYRKVAPQELGVNKREVDDAPFADLELRLLRHWAGKYTMMSPKDIDRAPAETLRDELDKTGRCLLHRVRWFQGVEEMGGLHVIGTERHESRRIDNQLRGRCGRQGDRGSSRFFVSLEDDMMKLFAGETMQNFLARFGGIKEGDSIEHPWISKSIERVQRKVEEHYFQMRKNLLDYDEVREHQRQRFYGVRQRVLEGRDVKGLILDWIEDAVTDNAARFLDSEYAATCASDFAKAKIESEVPPDRLRGKDVREMVVLIKKEARDDARAMINMTLGEYLPAEGSDVDIDFDAAGLASWAKGKFGIDLDTDRLHKMGANARAEAEKILLAAAFARIENTDLSGIAQFLQTDYGIQEFCKWANEKFTMNISVDEVKLALKSESISPVAVVMNKAVQQYREREIKYPIEYVIDITKQLMAFDRQQAFGQLMAWSNQRFQMNLTPETLMKTPPQQLAKDLLAKSEQFVNENRLEAEIQAAMACTTDEELDRHLQQRFGVGIPEAMRYLEPDEREDAIRARVESILRAELLQLERTILLDTMDDLWKGHLYAMDQLRESIGFRAFSQQDPRIEFKREGSHMFTAMLQNVRDRVTDYIFKAKLTPRVAPPGGMPGGMQGAPGGRMPPPTTPIPRPPRPVVGPGRPIMGSFLTGSSGGGFSGTIAGPGIGGVSGGISGPGLPGPAPAEPDQGGDGAPAPENPPA